MRHCFFFLSVLYNGSLADEIVYAVKVGNGSMAPSDLASYSPVLGFSEKTTFQDFDIVVPASSFGGTFLLNALETIQVGGLPFRKSRYA